MRGFPAGLWHQPGHLRKRMRMIHTAIRCLHMTAVDLFSVVLITEHHDVMMACLRRSVP